MRRAHASFLKTNQLGKVTLSMDTVERLSDEELLSIYAQFGVILRVEDRFYNNTTELLIANPSLETVREGEIIPDYVITFDKTTNQVSFERQDFGSQFPNSPLIPNVIPDNDDATVVI